MLFWSWKDRMCSIETRRCSACTDLLSSCSRKMRCGKTKSTYLWRLKNVSILTRASTTKGMIVRAGARNTGLLPNPVAEIARGLAGHVRIRRERWITGCWEADLTGISHRKNRSTEIDWQFPLGIRLWPNRC